MPLYLLLPLIACVSSAVLATGILTRDTNHGANRLAAAILYGVAFWAGCEALGSVTPSGEVALRLIKLSALGWVMIGPMALHLVIEMSGEPASGMRRKLPKLYAASLGFLLLEWMTPWMHEGVVATSTGWGLELGPVFPLFGLFSVSAMGWGLYRVAQAARRLPSPAERSQSAWVGAGLLVPMLVVPLTEGILPSLGVDFPRLGSLSFVVLGGTVAWSLHRYGFALLAPTAYATEIIDSLQDGLVMLRLDGRIRTANAAMARLAGCSRQALCGLPIQNLLDSTSPAWPTALRQAGEIECSMRPLEGAPFPVSISTRVLRGGDGERSGVSLLVRDQRKLVELRERLQLAGRMAAVGQVAAGVAHEINNPVAYVRANLVLLRQHWQSLGEPLPEDDDKRAAELEENWAEGLELIDESLEGVARAAAIVQSIRSFSHAGQATRERVDLNDLLRAAHGMAAPRLREGTTLSLDTGDLPQLCCCPGEIQLVILNLLLNAIDAVRGSGTIRATTRREGESLRLSVRDDGVGIPEDALGRVFDPFFTTKDVGEGTGLGLSISREIVTNHGGQLTLTSTPSQGTTFALELPIELAGS